MNEWMNKWKCSDLKCIRKPTRSQLSVTQHANKSGRWVANYFCRNVNFCIKLLLTVQRNMNDSKYMRFQLTSVRAWEGTRMCETHARCRVLIGVHRGVIVRCCIPVFSRPFPHFPASRVLARWQLGLQIGFQKLLRWQYTLLAC